MLSRLRSAWPKVPRTLFFVPEEESPLGAEFYVMERIPGIILRRRLPDGMRLVPADARRLCLGMIDRLVEQYVIVTLNTVEDEVDPRSVGGDDFGYAVVTELGVDTKAEPGIEVERSRRVSHSYPDVVVALKPDRRAAHFGPSLGPSRGCAKPRPAQPMIE